LNPAQTKFLGTPLAITNHTQIHFNLYPIRVGI